jgi:hypothetical protein
MYDSIQQSKSIPQNFVGHAAKKLHPVISGLRPDASIIAQRIVFSLLLVAAGLLLVQPCAGQSGTWMETGSLDTARDLHTATLLPNGKVLVAGGDVTVTANNVHDDQGNTLASAAASMGLLVGDVTGDGRVFNDDIAAVRAVQGQQANSANFRADVTLDGRINNQDMQTVRSHKGDVLP